MADFSALLDEVYTITNRPDLVAETTTAVKAATLKAHHSEFYPKDIYETGIHFGESAYLQQLEFRQEVPVYRAFKYARVIDASTTPITLRQFFEMIVPENSLDSYKMNRENVVYTAGSQLNFRSITQFQDILFGCYVHPILSPVGGYNSWIATEHPYVIIYEAARQIFRMIGFEEQAARMDQIVAEELQALKVSQLALAGE